MNKLSMLYVSPLWPMRSGISEYSKLLLDGLDEYFDITILVDNYKPVKTALNKDYKILQYNKKVNYNLYDVILYNFGNNPDYHLYMYNMMRIYKGFTILHDVSLYYLTCEYYRQNNHLFNAIYQMEGIRGICKIKDSLKNNKVDNLLFCKNLSSELLLNREVLNNSNGVFVHSKYAANIISNIKHDLNVHVINLVQPIVEKKNSGSLRKLFCLDKSDYIVASFGYISETKQNHVICKMINDYNNSHEKKIHYIMVGDGNYVDNYLNKFIHKTGFIENSETFLDYIGDCDLIMNLRWPYNGESSATVLQCMSMGKRCFVTDIGAFSEIDDEAVIKVSPDIVQSELYDIFCKNISNSYGSISENAIAYIENNCSVHSISKKIYTAIQSAIN